jgi:DNA-binding SARP family transcriptional activator
VGARNWLEQARRLYRGDFLAEDADAEWARPERNRLRELAAEMLRALTDLELRHGDLGAASVHARQLSQMLPLDSDVHETFLRICLEMGRHSEAARGHEIFRHRLLRHFGREPGFTLAELTAGSAHPSEPGPVARARTSWR